MLMALVLGQSYFKLDYRQRRRLYSCKNTMVQIKKMFSLHGVLRLLMVGVILQAIASL